MTLLLDADYPELALILRAECRRKEIPFEVKDLNTQGFGA